MKLGSLLLLLGVLCAGPALSQQPVKQPPAPAPVVIPEAPKPPVFDTSSLERTIRDAVKEVIAKPHDATKETLDRDLVRYTERLADFTLALAVATVLLAGIAIWQGIQLRRTVDVSVRESQPVLFPHITDMSRLHPLQSINQPTLTHDANIFIAFDNYGKTPGIIRGVFANLFLTEMDKPPVFDVDKLTRHEYPVWVAGEARGQDIQTGTLDLKQSITFTAAEVEELISDAKGRYRRFALIGKVIYDDLFGTRHTSHFYVKVRVWRVDDIIHMFQVAQGGSQYIKVVTEKIPNTDPLTVS